MSLCTLSLCLSENTISLFLMHLICNSQGQCANSGTGSHANSALKLYSGLEGRRPLAQTELLEARSGQ